MSLSAPQADWHLNYIKLTNESTQETKIFNFNKWIKPETHYEAFAEAVGGSRNILKFKKLKIKFFSFQDQKSINRLKYSSISFKHAIKKPMSD